MSAPPVDRTVWSGRGTTPAAIEQALRDLVVQRAAEQKPHSPTRVLNMVVIVDASRRGEVGSRLERVGRFHPSRTVVCSVVEGRAELDAWASISCDRPAEPGGISLCREAVEIELGPRHLRSLATVVDPVLVADVTTVVWSPHGYPEAVDALAPRAGVVLVDSIDHSEPAAALDRVAELAGRAYVVDLAWIRSLPWRERIAAAFDPPDARARLAELASVSVRHGPGSAVAGLELLGWLCSRLGWEPAALTAQGTSRRGTVAGPRGAVELGAADDPGLEVPGLAGVELITADGHALSLDRGQGGLVASQRSRDGREARWQVIGASRGEPGILGEGVRQALLRDPTYLPAARAARVLTGP